MSIDDVRVGDGAIVEEVVTYQGLILAFSGGPDHTHDPAGARSLLNLAFCEAFEVVANSLDWRFFKRKRCIIDENESSLWGLLEIKDVETSRSRRKLDHPRRSEDLEDTPAIFAIVGDLKLLTKFIEGEDIGNTPIIEVNRSISEVGLLGSIHRTVVAMNPDRSSSRADVGDMLRLGEEVNRGLAIQEEEIRVDRAARRGGRL
jgi:hypothetical protein